MSFLSKLQSKHLVTSTFTGYVVELRQLETNIAEAVGGITGILKDLVKVNDDVPFGKIKDRLKEALEHALKIQG